MLYLLNIYFHPFFIFLNHVNEFFYLLCLLLYRRLRTCYMMRAPINTNMVYDDDDDDDDVPGLRRRGR